MDHKQFSFLRQRLQKTQKQMANLLGTSLKGVQSFEQGWRKVPVHIERQMLFLISCKRRIAGKSRPCWDIRKCPPENREACPAWEFKVGALCWFINGMICQGKVQGSWAKKMKVCQSCEVFAQIMEAQSLQLTGRVDIGRGRRGDEKRKWLIRPIVQWLKE